MLPSVLCLSVKTHFDVILFVLLSLTTIFHLPCFACASNSSSIAFFRIVATYSLQVSLGLTLTAGSIKLLSTHAFSCGGDTSVNRINVALRSFLWRQVCYSFLYATAYRQLISIFIACCSLFAQCATNRCRPRHRVSFNCFKVMRRMIPSRMPSSVSLLT